MLSSRRGSHRSMYRAGAFHGRPQRQAYLAAKAARCVRLLGEILCRAEPVSRDVYRIPGAELLLPQSRQAVEDAEPFMEEQP